MTGLFWKAPLSICWILEGWNVDENGKQKKDALEKTED